MYYCKTVHFGIPLPYRNLIHWPFALDLVLTHLDQVPNDVNVSSHLISDHHSVIFNLNMAKPPLPTTELTYWSLKAIDIDAFTSDMKEFRLLMEDVDELADT